MYGKIFDSMYDGTLVEDWRALVTFQQFIVLCDANGIVDMTPHAISRRTGIPYEHIDAGIKILETIDPHSRTPEEGGCRIKLIDDHRPWGWYIVNHKKYRDMRNAEDRREYMRVYMQEKRKQLKLTEVNSKQSLTQLANTDTDTDTDIKDIAVSKKTDKVPYQKIIDLYHKKLPDLPKVAKLTPKRKGQIRQRFKEDMHELFQWENYFDYVSQSDFLMGRVPPRDGRAPFRADIEWLTNSTNFTKIAENKYHV